MLHALDTPHVIECIVVVVGCTTVYSSSAEFDYKSTQFSYFVKLIRQ